MSNMNVCSNTTFPFIYYNTAGQSINGELNKEGLCVFPDANCNIETAVYDCCQAQTSLKTTGSNYMFIAFILLFTPVLYIKVLSKTAEERAASKQDQMDRVPSWVRGQHRLLTKLFMFGLAMYIMAQVLVPIMMRQSIQSVMNVGSRNSLIAAEAFLVPFSEIFQFVEDIVLVRVNYAMGRKNKKQTDQLVHAGISGCICTGLVAAIIATILGIIPPVLQGLTSPGLANDQELYPGCSLIDENNGAVLSYWLMEAWSFPGTQLGMVLSGFMYGAQEMETLGWLGGISIALIPLIWFVGLNGGGSSNTLFLLGSAEFAAAWALPLLSILYIVSPLGKDLREHTGVELSLHKLYTSVAHSFGDVQEEPEEKKAIEMIEESKEKEDGSEDADKSPHNEEPPAVARPPMSKQIKLQSTKDLLMEGLKIMGMDVAIQFCISLSIYLALIKDAAIGYQLTALQSALPVYGLAYSLGLGIIIKIAGPQLIARGAFKKFAAFARLTVLCGFLLMPLIIGVVVPFRTSLAFSYGENACAYAADNQCLPFFTKVFGANGTGGQFTLPFTFDAFAMGASVEALFFVLRATMLACLDLNFMMWSTLGAMIVYIPVIIVATLVPPFGSEAIAFFVAMYIPQVVLIFLFAVRLEKNIRAMLKGEPGAWSDKTPVARSSVRASYGSMTG